MIKTRPDEFHLALGEILTEAWGNGLEMVGTQVRWTVQNGFLITYATWEDEECCCD